MSHDEPTGNKLSSQDLDLISLLQWAPRMPWGEAAEILGVHPTTLAGRWERLQEAGQAWITAQVNVSGSPNQLAFIELSCDRGRWDCLVDELCAMPEVLSLDAFAPGPDLGLTVVSRDLGSLSRLLEDRIVVAAGVTGAHVMLSSRLHHGGDMWRLDHLAPAQREACRAWADRERRALPESTTPLTETHRPVVEALMRDGRAGAADVARTTGLHPATARRHVQKVLASGLLSIRCDLRQQESATPVTAQWFVRVDASHHEAAAAALARDPRTRVVSSLTGPSNMMVVMWLARVEEVLEAERAIQELVQGVDIRSCTISLRTIKRMGRVFSRDDPRSTVFVPPLIHLG